VHQLKSLDAALYKGLTALRSYQGAFEDLELNFTVTEDVSDVETSAVNLSSARIGTGRVVELIEQGSNIKVTRDNVEEYIALVAKYRMQTQIAEQCRAFKLGLCDVIDREWLSLLCWTESEFALLLNGEPLVHGIDIAAMQQHVVYAGGYHAHHPVILTFWEVLSEFTPVRHLCTSATLPLTLAIYRNNSLCCSSTPRRVRVPRCWDSARCSPSSASS
jgi:ubiquitin-protein ligase E3 C